MNRRTFMKAAAGTTMLGAIPPVAASQDQVKTRAWPKTVYLDNPIANGLFPLQFVEAIPFLVRGLTDFAYSGKDLERELFRFTAHEWMTDAVLFRGMEIKPRDPSGLVNQKLRGIKLGLYVDDYKVADGFTIGDFMDKGGRAFRRWDRSDATKTLYCTYLGWANEGGSPDEDRFLGYFLPNKTCISVKADALQAGSIAVEIKCDMARYSTKK